MQAFPLIMGILNLTEDSFSDGGRWLDPKEAIIRGIKIYEEGAAYIDIGAESTRPGAREIPLETEWERIRPVLTALRRQLPEIKISIDTQKAEIARRAIEHGADMINDISALQFDPQMAEVLAENPQVELVMMHIQGRPQNMQIAPYYEDILSEIKVFFAEKLDFANQKGIAKKRIYLDPGIGFGKNLEHNLMLLANLDYFEYERLILGASRKSFIGEIDGSTATQRIGGSLAAAALSFGAVKMIRVHDVMEHRQFYQVHSAIKNYRRS